MKKKITFNDIAKKTNFSKTTISRYFNNPDSLTEESKKKIENALVELDYKENKVARSLANGKTEMIDAASRSSVQTVPASRVPWCAWSPRWSCPAR